MCPITASPANDISAYWSDTELILCLDKMQKRTSGSSLPSNVITDVNPCRYEPSNLPLGAGDIWYFVPLEGLKQTKIGIWKEKGEACQIYSDSSITGWRTTLEFYEGQTPNGHRTGWVMQEYWISCKDPIKQKGSSSLCRVFLTDGEDGNNVLCNKDNRPSQASMSTFQAADKALDFPQVVKIPQDECIANEDYVELDDLDNVLRSKDKRPGQASMSTFQSADNAIDFPHAVKIPQDECIANEGYVELDDLDNPWPSSSSSDNSSRFSLASDVYFDSVAMLQELEREDEGYSQPKPTCHKLSISRPSEMILSVIPGASPDKERESPTQPIREEHSLPASTVDRRLSDGDCSQGNAKKRPSSGSGDAGASSSSQKPGTDRGKKVLRGKTMKKFFCFLVF